MSATPPPSTVTLPLSSAEEVPPPVKKRVWTDPAMIISLWVTGQFFALIIIFSFWPSKMDSAAKTDILQTYVIAFTAAWGYWLGSSAGSKAKDEKAAAGTGAARG